LGFGVRREEEAGVDGDWGGGSVLWEKEKETWAL
jgi:hypothetical protein